jgi:short-subunit dehydrogenase
MDSLKDKFGSWALITGASSGIGEEFAVQLAQTGFNLILLARREELLKELSARLINKYKIQVKYAKIDLTHDDFLQQIEKLVGDIEIRLLISNAGSMRMGAFCKIPMEDFEQTIRLNVLAQMKIAHWFTNSLLEKKLKGGLLMLSSGEAYQGIPYSADYSACKAYILNLGEALNYELRETGIYVTVLLPGPVDTISLTQNPDANVVEHLPVKPQSVDEVVKEGLQAIMKNKPTHIAGRNNRVSTFIMKTFMSRYKVTTIWGKTMYKMVHIK